MTSKQAARCGAKCRHFCSNAASALLGPVGILLLIVVYSCAGGGLFQLLEEKTARQFCKERQVGNRRAQVKAIGSIINAFADPTSDNLVDNLTNVLDTYRESVGLYGQHEDCKDSGWGWAASTFFAVTIISTIGYGNIALNTVAGRIVAICYACVGIPIFGLFLALLGVPMTNLFSCVYKKIRSLIFRLGGKICTKMRKRKSGAEEEENRGRELEERRNENWHNNYDVNISSNAYSKDWYEQARKTPNIDFDANIGEGGVSGGGGGANKKPKTKDFCGQVGGEFEDSAVDERMTRAYHRAKNSFDDNADDDDEYDDEEDVMVPLTLTAGILILYLLLGAGVFGHSEGWTTTDSIYFSFVTLSTIGFGDYVPSVSSATAGILSACYILLGMALLAMCFAFAEEKIKRRIVWLKAKLKEG